MRDSYRSEGGLNPEIARKLRRADSLVQYFQQASERRTSLQLTALLSSSNKTIFLDEQKKYVIVDYQYLESLQNDLSKSKTDLQNLMMAIKKQQSHKAEMSKMIELKQNEIKNMKNQHQKDTDRIFRSGQKVLDSQLAIDTKQIEYYQLSQNYLRVLAQKQQLAANQYLYHDILTRPREQKEVQTVYEAQNQQIRPSNLSAQQRNQTKDGSYKQMSKSDKLNVELALAQKYEHQIQRLKKSFAEVLEDIKKQTNQKLLTIEEQKVGIQTWSSENRRLHAENEELKRTIKHINEKEEKLKIWKNTLQNYVQGVQRDHSFEPQQLAQMSDPVSPGTQSFAAEEKIKLLLTTISRLKMQREQRNKRFAEVRLLLEQVIDPSAVSEENIVGTLLNLSTRVKQGLKCLLEEL